MKKPKKLSEATPVFHLRRVSRDQRCPVYRKEHITKLTEDIDGKQKQMKFKMLHQSKAQSSKDWETYDKIQREMNTQARNT